MGGCNVQVVKNKTLTTIKYTGGPYHGMEATKTATTTEKCGCTLSKTEMLGNNRNNHEGGIFFNEKTGRCTNCRCGHSWDDHDY